MRPASFAERTAITARDYRRLRTDARRPGQGRVRAECYFAMRENDLRGRLHQIHLPGLVIWGAEDNTVPLRDAGVVSDEWAEADLRILPKAGHWPHFERPVLTRRLVASFLGLPLLAHEREDVPLGDDTLQQTMEVARFLLNSDLGRGLSEANRMRLAAQMRLRVLRPGEMLFQADDTGESLFLVWQGNVEVWGQPTPPRQAPRRLTVIPPGQTIGELSFLDGDPYGFDVLAGPEGAQVLALSRSRLLALAEDDPPLGTRLFYNLSRAIARRARFAIWQRRATAFKPSDIPYWQENLQQEDWGHPDAYLQ